MRFYGGGMSITEVELTGDLYQTWPKGHHRSIYIENSRLPQMPQLLKLKAPHKNKDDIIIGKHFLVFRRTGYINFRGNMRI